MVTISVLPLVKLWQDLGSFIADPPLEKNRGVPAYCRSIPQKTARPMDATGHRAPFKETKNAESRHG